MADNKHLLLEDYKKPPKEPGTFSKKLLNNLAEVKEKLYPAPVHRLVERLKILEEEQRTLEVGLRRLIDRIDIYDQECSGNKHMNSFVSKLYTRTQQQLEGLIEASLALFDFEEAFLDRVKRGVLTQRDLKVVDERLEVMQDYTNFLSVAQSTLITEDEYKSKMARVKNAEIKLGKAHISKRNVAFFDDALTKSKQELEKLIEKGKKSPEYVVSAELKDRIAELKSKVDDAERKKAIFDKSRFGRLSFTTKVTEQDIASLKKELAALQVVQQRIQERLELEKGLKDYLEDKASEISDETSVPLKSRDLIEEFGLYKKSLGFLPRITDETPHELSQAFIGMAKRLESELQRAGIPIENDESHTYDPLGMRSILHTWGKMLDAKETEKKASGTLTAEDIRQIDLYDKKEEMMLAVFDKIEEEKQLIVSPEKQPDVSPSGLHTARLSSTFKGITR